MMNNYFNIDAVLSSRKKSLETVEVTIQEINYLINQLEKIELLRQELLKFRNLDEFSKSTLEEINYAFPLIIKSLEDEKSVWNKLMLRFSRNSINIGVIGRQRQGKSTFLQKLTNLTSEKIPAREGFPCTSVQSIIYHTDEEQYAEIIYYNELEFIEQVLNPYLINLNKYYDFSGVLIKSIQDFKSINLRKPEDVESDNAIAEGWYENFYEIWNNLEDYENNVINADVKPVDLEDIKNYVQYQYNGESQKLASYNYVGIKKVIINCEFENPNVHKLGVIDLPGLGSTRLGDESRLIRALGEDVDFVLFIKYPSHVNSDWEDKDSELYQAANTILSKKLPLKEWSFIIINKDEDNVKMCNQLEEVIHEKSEINFSKILKIDVSDKEDANYALKESIDYLKNNIHRLDNYLIDQCLINFADAKTDIFDLLKKMRKISFLNNTENKFDNYFESFYTELTNVIIEYRKKINTDITDENDWFRKEIEKIVKRTKESITFPTQKEFERISNRELTQYKLYHVLVHHVRSNILRNFHDFTNKQQIRINQQKEEIISLLRTQRLFGNLTFTNGVDNLSFIEIIKNKIIEIGQFEGSGILEGFDFLDRFKVSYEGSIQEIVYNIIIQFFSDKIQELNSAPDLQRFYAKSQAIVSTDLENSEDNLEIVTIQREKEKSLAFVKNNVEDLLQICVSVIGLFPGAEMITNVYDICKSLLNIFNSEKSIDEKSNEAEKEIKKLEKTVFEVETQSVKKVEHESLESLKATVFFVLDMCMAELTNSIGNSMQKTRVSMTKEFFDHLIYTTDSESEWRKLLRAIRDDLWIDFKKDSLFSKKLEEWNFEINKIQNLVKI